MKTRIISGAVIIAVAASFFTLGKLVSPFFITAFIALASVIAVYELVKNAAGITSKTAFIGSMVYCAGMIVLLDKTLKSKTVFHIVSSSVTYESKSIKGIFIENWDKFPFVLSAFYFVFAVAVILKFHKDFSLARIATFTSMPIFLSYAFSTLGSIISSDNGIYYLLLLLNFSAVCDTGAYFVGSTMGRHKLCPEISPKKTVEGALGGIVSSIIVSIILILCFGRTEHLISTLILTIPFCILGIFGDLFASAIKRSVALKDYSNLIPGHGGVLDRTDSILMIAPILYIFESFGVI